MKREATTATDIDPYARRLIKHKVNHLIARHDIRRDDLEDLEQELALHAHLAAPKYDPSRGASTTFYDRVLACKIASIIQARSAQQRNPRREERDGDVTTLAVPSTQTRFEDAADVRAVLTGLAPELRPLANRFMSGDTEADAGRALRWSRGQVRHRRTLIAQQFANAGLAPLGRGRRR